MHNFYNDLKLLANHVVKFYTDDFEVHDKRAFAEAQEGDVFFWQPRESGTHLIKVNSGTYQTKEYLEAVVQHDNGPWYKLHTGTGKISRIENEDALEEYNAQQVKF